MKKIISVLLTVFFVSTLIFMIGCTPELDSAPTTNPDPDPDPDPEPIKEMIIHSIYDLNKEPIVLDSHAGEENFSSLEMDFNSYTLIPAATLTPAGIANTMRPIYPRIKRTQSGEYVLFYHNNLIGMHIYYSYSSDLKNWSKGQFLQREKNITLGGEANQERYHGADAVVLDNGDILVAFSFRPNLNRFQFLLDNGVMISRSTDNGRTWSEPQVIWRGPNWEPFLLQLPSGRIQCYFTDGSERVGNIDNSGTSISFSLDNGLTWNPPTGSHFVIRQLRFTSGTNHFWTDQMPVVRLLNDGKTLVGIMEANIAPQGSDNYRLCLVYGEFTGLGNGWTRLTGNDVGPADRTGNVIQGAAGYITQFPSGETIISCNTQNQFSMKIGDSKARNFNGGWSASDQWLRPFPRLGWWGAMELDDSHVVIGTMHGRPLVDAVPYNSDASDGIQVARFILNHRIDAPSVSIKVDGDNRDWKHTDALFIGSESPMQTVFRAAHDSQNLYILAEQLDKTAITGNNIKLYIHAAGVSNTSLNTNSIRISLDSTGLTGAARWSGSQWNDISIPGLILETNVPEKTGNSDSAFGFLAEMAIPLSTFGNASGTSNFLFNAVTASASIEDTFSFSRVNDPSTWKLIRVR